MKNKKTLFIGGIKSGKSLNAEIYTLKNSSKKPIYLATTEFIDDGMQRRVDDL
jgi:adenosylcobinamide kinase/adenosylcobinamide-phosphate guanylyltransferase